MVTNVTQILKQMDQNLNSKIDRVNEQLENLAIRVKNLEKEN